VLCEELTMVARCNLEFFSFVLARYLQRVPLAGSFYNLAARYVPSNGKVVHIIGINLML